jgi:large subunit ribosomal protein L10
MGGEVISIDEIEALARLPAVEVLHGQLVGTLASPITGLVRGLNQLIAGVAQQLQQIADQGLVSGEAPVAAEEAPAAEEEPAPVEEAAAEEPVGGAAEQGTDETETPSEEGSEQKEN